MNKFMSAKFLLNEIPGESFSESHLVILFLIQIEDPEYQNLKKYLLQSGAITLDVCVHALRKEEVQKEMERKQNRDLKHTMRRILDSERGSYRDPPRHFRRV